MLQAAHFSSTPTPFDTLTRSHETLPEDLLVSGDSGEGNRASCSQQTVGKANAKIGSAVSFPAVGSKRKDRDGESKL